MYGISTIPEQLATSENNIFKIFSQDKQKLDEGGESNEAPNSPAQRMRKRRLVDCKNCSLNHSKVHVSIERSLLERRNQFQNNDYKSISPITSDNIDSLQPSRLIVKIEKVDYTRNFSDFDEVDRTGGSSDSDEETRSFEVISQCLVSPEDSVSSGDSSDQMFLHVDGDPLCPLIEPILPLKVQLEPFGGKLYPEVKQFHINTSNVRSEIYTAMREKTRSSVREKKKKKRAERLFNFGRTLKLSPRSRSNITQKKNDIITGKRNISNWSQRKKELKSEIKTQRGAHRSRKDFDASMKHLNRRRRAFAERIDAETCVRKSAKFSDCFSPNNRPSTGSDTLVVLGTVQYSPVISPATPGPQLSISIQQRKNVFPLQPHVEMIQNDLCLPRANSIWNTKKFWLFHNWCHFCEYDETTEELGDSCSVSASGVCYAHCSVQPGGSEVMVTCARCQTPFHQGCLSVLPHDFIPQDTYFVLVCAACNQGQEFYSRIPINWLEIVYLMMVRLGRDEEEQPAVAGGAGSGFFHLHSHILPYLRHNPRRLIPHPQAESVVLEPIFFSLWIHRFLLENPACFENGRLHGEAASFRLSERCRENLPIPRVVINWPQSGGRLDATCINRISNLDSPELSQLSCDNDADPILVEMKEAIVAACQKMREKMALEYHSIPEMCADGGKCILEPFNHQVCTLETVDESPLVTAGETEVLVKDALSPTKSATPVNDRVSSDVNDNLITEPVIDVPSAEDLGGASASHVPSSTSTSPDQEPRSSGKKRAISSIPTDVSEDEYISSTRSKAPKLELEPPDALIPAPVIVPVKHRMTSSKLLRDDPTTEWIEEAELNGRKKRPIMSSEQILAQFGLTESSFEEADGPPIPVVPYRNLPDMKKSSSSHTFVAIGRYRARRDGNWMQLLARVEAKPAKKSR